MCGCIYEVCGWMTMGVEVEVVFLWLEMRKKANN